MSHIVSIQTAIKDIDAVKAACAELGLEFKENQRTCAFWPTGGAPQTHPCTHAIALPVGTYRMELGLVLKPDGTYELVGDELLKLDDTSYWNKALFGLERNPLGQNFNKLLQLYGVHKATLEAKKRGYLVTRTVIPNTQKIQLTVTGM